MKVGNRVERVNIKIESLERIIELLEAGNIDDAIGLLRFAARVETRRELRAQQRQVYNKMCAAFRCKRYEEGREYEAQLKAYEKFFL